MAKTRKPVTLCVIESIEEVQDTAIDELSSGLEEGEEDE